jgi:multimeric flavodoxin WrbA
MAIIGSPRKGGNTALLVDRVIEGFSSTGDVAVEKCFIVDKNIEHYTGGMTCVFPSMGTGQCMINDDMAALLECMRESDAFIFGSPNHMRTITAPLLNFLTLMLPLLVFRVHYDEQDKRIGGQTSSKIQGKKVAMVISQGEPFFVHRWF